MLVQYRAMKQAHPDALLFFRMGDFYELFFEDAVTAAAALDIALTCRGKVDGQEIPMCGVPVANVDPYLERLVRKGFRVAIGEQLESPASARGRPGRPLVRRGVVRVVTPGTLTEDALLEPRRPNHLAALANAGGELGLAWVELSTGLVGAEPQRPDGLAAALARVAPRELLLDPAAAREPKLGPSLAPWQACTTQGRTGAFAPTAAAARLASFYEVATPAAFGAFGAAELAALGALVDYLESTQPGRAPRLERPRRVEPADILQLDPATRRNLDLDRRPDGSGLLDVIDCTRTAAGGRLLTERLAAPLTQPAAIEARLDEVAACVDDVAVADRIRDALRDCPDLERALGRLALGRGGPRDLHAVSRALATARTLADAVATLPTTLSAPLGLQADLEGLLTVLTATLAEAPPTRLGEGPAIRQGASAELDAAIDLRDLGRRHILALEARYRDETGASGLRVRHNGQIGHYVEVGAAQRARLGPEFLQRQSLAGAVRFTTAELSALEGALQGAAERAAELERLLVQALQERVLAAGPPLAALARALAALDVATSLADLARSRNWVRPAVDQGLELAIQGGRHPVVEEALRQVGRPFVANDCELGPAARLWLLTGPNMAGKSTFLRQNALIVLLGQMGSFVPATAARIGVVDRLFSRVGAGDDLAQGRSTFMVEMVETALILHQAGPRSFVILDEIGRGTATFDGLSIAWAVIERLHGHNRCRGLFATHYHELTGLTASLDALAVYSLKVQEWRGELVFLHNVGPGSADRSYGVHVARLAGLPPAVVARAQSVLAQLERQDRRTGVRPLAELPLFAALPPLGDPAVGSDAHAPAAAVPPAVATALAEVDPDRLTPRDALDLVVRLKALCGQPA